MKNTPSNVIDLADYGITDIQGPPWSPEAEQSVLGGLLLSNDAYDDVRAIIEAGHFFQFAHRKIFETIETLVVACKVADVITVHDALKQAGMEGDSVGLSYLYSLAQSVPSAANAPQYARIVRDAALRRTLLDGAARAREIAFNAEEADEALDQIATLFAAIDRTRAKSEPRRLADVMTKRSDYWADVETGSALPGVPTQLPTLDKALTGGIKPGRVIVLAARPSIGKTSLAQQIALAVARQNYGVLMLSQEMPEGELVDRAAANLGEVNLSHLIEGKMDDGEWSRISSAVDDVQALPFFLDDQPALTLLDIKAKVRAVQKQQSLSLVVIDYLQLCASSSTRDSRHHQIEAISRGLKAMAKELSIGVLLLSQINRASTQRDEPSLADLKESGAIEEDADVVIFLQPKGNLPDGSQLLAAILAKNRQGRRVRVALSFRGATQRWVESTADVSARAPQSQH